ncbi:protease complex subunit PrcB family protein [Candidatus Kaiserbacteria bacterium]|nr:protease complex subunit PrcB family protein [Candidatus Kaiserbacteria bacterium]
MQRDAVILTSAIVVAVVVGVFVFFSNGGNLASVFSAVADNNSGNGVVQFTEIARGSQSAIERRVNYFITSSEQFNELWKIINAGGMPPKVDFKTHAVIAVFAGQEPAAGYEIAVNKIEDNGKRMVSITLAKPDGGCAVAQMTTTPYQLIVLPTTSLPLTHEDKIIETSCPS